MNEKEVLTEVEERRCCQSSLLSTFEEIAQTFLNSVKSERGNGKVFTFLQDYLDGSILINGAYSRRRTLLLAVHDLKEPMEAPSALRSKTLAKLDLLRVRPVPQVAFYQDIATAILRMEVVIRLEAMEAQARPATGAASVLASAPVSLRAPEDAGKPASGAAGVLASAPVRRPRAPASNLRTAGYGLAVAACCAASALFFQNASIRVVPDGSSARIAAGSSETPKDTGWVGGNPAWRGRDCGLPLSAARSAGAAGGEQKRCAAEKSFNAANLVMYSALSRAGLGSEMARPSAGASPVRETPNPSAWLTTIEANNQARSALLSEVKTQ